VVPAGAPLSSVVVRIGANPGTTAAPPRVSAFG